MNLQEIQEYILVHRPTAAYLGRLEMKAMTADAEKAGYFVPNLTGEPDLHRTEYCACPLYQVDSESHAGFQSRENAIAVAPPTQDSTEANQ